MSSCSISSKTHNSPGRRSSCHPHLQIGIWGTEQRFFHSPMPSKWHGQVWEHNVFCFLWLSTQGPFPCVKSDLNTSLLLGWTPAGLTLNCRINGFTHFSLWAGKNQWGRCQVKRCGQLGWTLGLANLPGLNSARGAQFLNPSFPPHCCESSRVCLRRLPTVSAAALLRHQEGEWGMCHVQSSLLEPVLESANFWGLVLSSPFGAILWKWLLGNWAPVSAGKEWVSRNRTGHCKWAVKNKPRPWPSRLGPDAPLQTFGRTWV